MKGLGSALRGPLVGEDGDCVAGEGESASLGGDQRSGFESHLSRLLAPSLGNPPAPLPSICPLGDVLSALTRRTRGASAEKMPSA